ncbi:unnamed protein product [Kuraishia capsulata CBS 1993]|uniref:Uncharacterized protein n=1 Tax=Kuraishia capsulata CBS 1993 TaxID=1382522 RepID=W6MRY4_9ASCO|nr:uncharacterized protein KUCA_T00005135001 [Kuraishia capsulata CBS 1993]CDK29148.1 unnamed protein product [Kuraishia capsulata CBS 1993]
MSDALIEASNNVLISTANILDRMMLLSSSSLVLPNNSLVAPLSNILDQDIKVYNKVLDELSVEFMDAEHALQYLKQKLAKEEETKRTQEQQQQQQLQLQQQQAQQQQQKDQQKQVPKEASQPKQEFGDSDMNLDIANLDFGHLIDKDESLEGQKNPGESSDPNDMLSMVYKDDNQDFLADYAIGDAGANDGMDYLTGLDADQNLALQDFNLGDLLTEEGHEAEQDLGLVPDGEMNHLFDEFDILLGNDGA